MGMISEDDVIKTISGRQKQMHVILTGRDASDKLLELADCVSSITEIKHHFAKDISSQIGVEL